MKDFVLVLIGLIIACFVVFLDYYTRKHNMSTYASPYQASLDTIPKEVASQLEVAITRIIKADPMAKDPIKAVQQRMAIIEGYTAAHPEVKQKLTRYYSYYVPTFEKMILNYYSIIRYNIHNSEVQTGVTKFHETLCILKSTFDVLIADIMAPTVLNMSCETSALKTLSTIDGYSDPFQHISSVSKHS